MIYRGLYPVGQYFRFISLISSNFPFSPFLKILLIFYERFYICRWGASECLCELSVIHAGSRVILRWGFHTSLQGVVPAYALRWCLGPSLETVPALALSVYLDKFYRSVRSPYNKPCHVRIEQEHFINWSYVWVFLMFKIFNWTHEKLFFTS